MSLTVAVTMCDRYVIFCVLIACHSKESTCLRNIYTEYITIITVFCDEGKMSIMQCKMLKKGHIASQQTFHRDAGQTG